MSEPTAKNEPLTYSMRFHFYRIKSFPYKDNGETNESVIHKVATFLSQEMQKGNGILIDKHEAKGGNDARPLFVTNAVFMYKVKRIRFSMALLRTGKIPMLKPSDTFSLIPFDTSKGEIAEQTHFFIDYSTNNIVMCVEFNNNGPRISDIEYYFRIVARDKLKIAKGVQMELYMDTSIDKTLADLKKVLSLKVKIQPKKLSQLDSTLVGQYFTAISNLDQYISPSYVKLDLSFQNPGNKVASSQIDKARTNMAKSLLNSFKASPANIDAFDNFVVEYENEEGIPEFFNLLKGKKEIEKDVSGEIRNTRQVYELINSEFDEFIKML